MSSMLAVVAISILVYIRGVESCARLSLDLLVAVDKSLAELEPLECDLLRCLVAVANRWAAN